VKRQLKPCHVYPRGGRTGPDSPQTAEMICRGRGRGAGCSRAPFFVFLFFFPFLGTGLLRWEGGSRDSAIERREQGSYHEEEGAPDAEGVPFPEEVHLPHGCDEVGHILQNSNHGHLHVLFHAHKKTHNWEDGGAMKSLHFTGNYSVSVFCREGHVSYR